MGHIHTISFPLSHYDPCLRFKSLQLSSNSNPKLHFDVVTDGTNDDGSSSIEITTNEPPLQYIDNDSKVYPLLVKVPSLADVAKIELELCLGDEQLQSVRSSSSQSIYENLLVVVRDSKKTVHNVGPITVTDSHQSQDIQSHAYQLAPRIAISWSIPISKNVGRLDFEIRNGEKSSESEKLIQFSIYKEPQGRPSTTEKKVTISDTKVSLDLNDGPALRKLLGELETKIPILKSASQQAIQAGRNLETSLTAVRDQKVQFSNALKKFTQELDRGKVSENLVLQHVEPLFKNSAQDDEQLANNLRINLLNPMNQVFSNNNVNALSSNKKIFEDESSKYYTWLNKYLSSSTKSEDKLLLKRRQFELSKLDYLNFLADIAQNNSMNRELANYLITFTNNFDSSRRAPTSVHLVGSSSSASGKDQKSVERHRMRRAIELSKTETEMDAALISLKTASSPHNIFKSGLLYCYGGQHKQGWHKQWIVLENSMLTEYADWRKGSDRSEPIDLALCSFKPNTEKGRKFCFEIITSKGNRSVYQATSDAERDSWIKALYDAGQLIRFSDRKSVSETQSSSSASQQHKQTQKQQQQTLVDPLRRRFSSVSLKNVQAVQAIDPSNLVCCDCGASNDNGVEWISLNLLALFCVNCSSAHRSLGTSISKVRSLKLDNFTTEQTSLLSNINNTNLNKIFEDSLDPASKILPDTTPAQRLAFITDKYQHYKFLKPLPTAASPNNILIHGLRERNFYEMAWGLASGAKLNVKLEREGSEFTLLEYALSKPLDDQIFDLAEWLILNGFPLSKEMHDNLHLPDLAIEYWKAKIEKLHGKENGSSQLKELPKLNTTSRFEPDDRKVASPSSATARYSRNLIKKITSHNHQ